MAFSRDNSRHVASGLQGVDQNLRRELDAVEAVYFTSVSNTDDYQSSDSESESSDVDDATSNNLFENSLAPILGNVVSASDNSSEDTTAVTDQEVCSFLANTCGLIKA